jgi:hypothetical protein
MRHTKTLKHSSKFVLLTVLSSLALLLGACAELTTPTPASGPANRAAATATVAPGATAATVAPGATATAVPPTVTATPAPIATPTALPPTAILAATATPVPPRATPTKAPPAPTKVPATTRAVPTPGKADAKADEVGVSILTVNGNKPGRIANVTIQTSPHVECNIVYETPAKQTSTAKGLSQQTADENGRVTWSWQIAQNTAPGKGSVTVTCGDSSETRQITIS